MERGKLAHYEILEKIGSGGMGEVYLARDTKLDRHVALKVLPPELAGSAERRERFEREAKAIAALNHPNIVTVHSVEEADGIHFITMELVRGKRLTELIPKRGMPLDRFFDVAIPLADALASTHEHGIVHRDLKPDNLMIGDDGRLRILDFGLATDRDAHPDEATSEVPTRSPTREGQIMGTAPYMSPEQAEARRVDARSDIFSMGIVLYEMATGVRPFRGDTPISTLSSILRDTPPSVEDVNPAIPKLLGRVVRRCLQKDPERRYQSAKEIRNELLELKQELSSGTLEPASAPMQPFPWKIALVVIAGVGALGIVWMTVMPSRVAPLPRLLNPVQLTAAAGVEDFPTWSPDGETLAYHSQQSGNLDIWVQQVGGGPPVNRTSDHTGIDRYPSWSPDGKNIAFESDRDGGGYFVMSALGGPARKVTSASFEPTDVIASGPPQWLGGGDELASVNADEKGVYFEIVSVSTREVRRLALPPDAFISTVAGTVFDVAWSPGESRFTYVARQSRVAPISRIWLVRAETARGSR